MRVDTALPAADFTGYSPGNAMNGNTAVTRGSGSSGITCWAKDTQPTPGG